MSFLGLGTIHTRVCLESMFPKPNNIIDTIKEDFGSKPCTFQIQVVLVQLSKEKQSVYIANILYA